MSEAAQHLASILHPGRNPLSELLERLQANGWIICPPGHVPVPRSVEEAKAMHAVAESYLSSRERARKERSDG